jgi:hypothetical protein
MDIQGKIVQILPKQTGEGKNGTWEKQDYILETQAQYPKKVCFSVWGVKISQYNIQMGEFVSLGVDVESREYNGRWYTDVKAWKVAAGAGTTEGPSDFGSSAPPPPTFDNGGGAVDDDLPF